MTTTEISPAPAPLLPSFLTDHASCSVAKVGQSVARLMDAELEPLGFRVRHYQVLKTLADAGATSQQAIGTMLRIDGATMVSTIDDLEALGFVERRRKATDRRSYAIHLTSAGRAALRQADQAIERVNSRVVRDLSERERKRLHELLERLITGESLPRLVDELRNRGK